MTTLISKTIPSFCHKGQRVRVSSRHLVSAGRASIPILIIIIVLGCLGRRRGRLHKATKVSLPSSNMANTGVHLIHLSSECIKVSIHALKLRHDRIQSRTFHRSRGSRGGWSRRSGKSCCTESPRSKLCLSSFNSSGVNSTHNVEVVGHGKRNKKMV